MMWLFCSIGYSFKKDNIKDILQRSYQDGRYRFTIHDVTSNNKFNISLIVGEDSILFKFTKEQYFRSGGIDDINAQINSKRIIIKSNIVNAFINKPQIKMSLEKKIPNIKMTPGEMTIEFQNPINITSISKEISHILNGNYHDVKKYISVAANSSVSSTIQSMRLPSIISTIRQLGIDLSDSSVTVHEYNEFPLAVLYFSKPYNLPNKSKILSDKGIYIIGPNNILLHIDSVDSLQNV